jgi:hypothetical protein
LGKTAVTALSQLLEKTFCIGPAPWSKSSVNAPTPAPNKGNGNAISKYRNRVFIGQKVEFKQRTRKCAKFIRWPSRLCAFVVQKDLIAKHANYTKLKAGFLLSCFPHHSICGIGAICG